MQLCGKEVLMKKGFFNVILPETADGTVAVLLYGYIGREEKADADRVVSELMSLSSTYRNIDVRINSLGGEVFSGMAIFNALKNSTANVNIYVDGVAASMAGIIALCGRPLHMSRYSRLMLHQVTGGVHGTSEEIRAYADVVEQLTDTLVTMVADRSGLEAEEVRSRWFSGGDHWMTAQEVLDLGLAESIYDMKDGASPAADATAEAIYEFTNRQNSLPLTDTNMAILDELKKKSSFQNATTEEQVLAKINELENDAAKVPALQAKVTALENEKKEAMKAARTAYLDQAVADGRIQAAQKQHFLALMEHDEAGVKAVIDSMPKNSGRISSFIGSGKTASTSARQELEAMTWDQIDKEERLAELKNNYPDLYELKFNEQFK